MDDAARAQEMWTQFTGKTMETITLWADANQRVIRECMDFTTGAAKEGLRLYGDLQAKAIDGLKMVSEGAYGPQSAFRIAEENIQALTRTAERIQATAEQSGKGIQSTLTDAVTRTKEIYARA